MKAFTLKTLLAAIAVILLVAACDQPRLFESREDLKLDNSPLRGSNGDPVITMSISGGFAGVNRQLTIDSNGFVSFVDFVSGSRFTDYLTAAEYADLQAKFFNADFFHLNESYITEGAADLFIYELTYKSNGLSHRVIADDLAAPQSLREIIQALNAIIEELTAKLQLTLTASRDSIRIGETVKLNFGVKNLSDAPVTLNFRDGQVFDFYAIHASSLAAPQSTKVWNWAHEKVFTQALRASTLAAGELVTYEIEWDGRDNSGQALLGSVLVGAELVSVPGGSARLLPLLIQN